MTDNYISKEKLEKRRAEIVEALGRVNRSLQLELDRDIEEQAIEIEQEEVAITMEHNLRRELNDIENRLSQMAEE